MNISKLIACVLLSVCGALAQSTPPDYDGVLKTLGKQGDFKDNVLKINIPRNDLKVTIDGVPTPTPFGFGGWLAMTKGDAGMDVICSYRILRPRPRGAFSSDTFQTGYHRGWSHHNPAALLSLSRPRVGLLPPL